MLANLGLLIALWAVVRLAGDGDEALVVGLRGRRRPRDLLRVRRPPLPGRADRGVRVDRARPQTRGTRAGRPARPRPAPVARRVPALARRARRDARRRRSIPSPSLASLRDSTVPLFAGEHGAADATGPRTVQFLLIVAALTAAVLVLRRHGKREALVLLGGTALGTLALHALVAPLGPDIFAQRYLTSLVPLAVALLAGAIVLLPWRWATPAAAAALLGLGVAVFVQRYDRELEPDMAPVAALIEESDNPAVLTNSARVAYYLRELRAAAGPAARLRPGPRGHVRPRLPGRARDRGRRARAGGRPRGPWGDSHVRAAPRSPAAKWLRNRASWGSIGRWIRSPAAWRWSCWGRWAAAPRRARCR